MPREIKESSLHVSPRHKDRKNIIGKRYGRLIVAQEVDSTLLHRRMICLCDCGNYHELAMAALGRTKSCGCLRKENRRKFCQNKKGINHRRRTTIKGMKSERATYYAMIARCHSSTSPAFRNYGGRGISVCDRWRYDVDAFLSDMGVRPSPGHSLDRIDNDGNYEVLNCRWATIDQQAINRRGARLVTYNEETITVGQFGRIIGHGRHYINARIKKGLSGDQIAEGSNKAAHQCK